jgi:hypothetical protein
MMQGLSACLIRGIIVYLIASVSTNYVLAAEATFKGKLLTVIIPSTEGNGTDALGRLMGRFLHEYLPGKPTVICQNIPGAGGLKGLNYFAQQVKPDGLTSIAGSASNLDPTTLRNPTVRYDPKQLQMYGGFPAPTALVILRKDATSRLYNKSLPPVVMGDENAVRNSDQMAVWGPNYLNWNVRWVLGYPGNNGIQLALTRGEIDMMVTYDSGLLGDLYSTGLFVYPAQSGDVQNGKLARSARFRGCESAWRRLLNSDG